MATHTTFSILNLLISPLSAIISLLSCDNPTEHVPNEPSSASSLLVLSQVERVRRHRNLRGSFQAHTDAQSEVTRGDTDLGSKNMR